MCTPPQLECVGSCPLTSRPLTSRPLAAQVRSERRHLWVAQLYALEPLAEGWSKQTDGRGRAYFYHAETKETRWDRPIT